MAVRRRVQGHLRSAVSSTASHLWFQPVPPTPLFSHGAWEAPEVGRGHQAMCRLEPHARPILRFARFLRLQISFTFLVHWLLSDESPSLYTLLPHLTFVKIILCRSQGAFPWTVPLNPLTFLGRGQEVRLPVPRGTARPAGASGGLGGPGCTAGHAFPSDPVPRFYFLNCGKIYIT